MARPLSLNPPYPLWGAEQRARRARVHIRTLDWRLQRWANKHVEIFVTASDPGQKVLELEEAGRFIARSSIWIGEAIYNLRSALDYLVYDFAVIANGNTHVRDTQFPICDSWSEFEAMRTGVSPKGGKTTQRLRCVPPEVIDRFRQLQPCATPPCNWTRRLRELSNPDKHRSLASLRLNAAVIGGDHPDLTALIPNAIPNPDHQHFVVALAFRDTDEDVVDTLNILQRQIRALIEEFKPAFKRTGDVFQIEYEAPLPLHGAPPAD